MITVDPADLTVGQTATVCVRNSSKPGTTIQVRIDNGEGEEQLVDVVLDNDGNGCADWVVPDWMLANFNYSTCPEVVRPISP